MNPNRHNFYNNADDEDGYPDFSFHDDNKEDFDFDEDDTFFDDVVSGKQNLNGDDSAWQITQNMSPGLLSLFGMDNMSSGDEVKIAWTAPNQNGLANSEPIIRTPFNISSKEQSIPISQHNRYASQGDSRSSNGKLLGTVDDDEEEEEEEEEEGEEADLMEFFSSAVNESVAEFLDDVIAGKQNLSGDDSAWQITENMSPGLLALFGKTPNQRSAVKDSTSTWQAPSISGLQNSDPIIRTAFNVPSAAAAATAAAVPRLNESASWFSSESIAAMKPTPPLRVGGNNDGQAKPSSYQRYYDTNGENGVLVRRKGSDSNSGLGSTSVQFFGGSQSSTTIDTVATKDRNSDDGDAVEKIENESDGDDDDDNDDDEDEDDDEDDDDNSEEERQRMMRDDEDEDAYADRILSMMSHNLKIATGVRASDAPLESDWKPPSHAGLGNSERIIFSLK